MKALKKAAKALALCLAANMAVAGGIHADAAEGSGTSITVEVDLLRVRESPSLEGTFLGYVNTGDTLQYIRTVDEEWVAVRYRGRTGYVASRYVTIGHKAHPRKEEVSEAVPLEESVAAQEIEKVQETQGCGGGTGAGRDRSLLEELLCEENQSAEEAERGKTPPKEQEASGENVSGEAPPQQEHVPEEVPVREDAAVGGGSAGEEASVPEDSYEVLLLGALIQCEAVGECYEGQVAVGEVVMNRVEDPRYPGTVAEVIYQSGQFTPVKSGKVDRVLNSEKINEGCLQAAREAIAGASVVGDRVSFRRAGKTKGLVIGNHVFF